MRDIPSRVPHRRMAITALASSHSPITNWYSTRPIKSLMIRVGKRKVSLSFQEIHATHSNVASADIQMARSRSDEMDSLSPRISSRESIPVKRALHVGYVSQNRCMSSSVPQNARHAIGSGRRIKIYIPLLIRTRQQCIGWALCKFPNLTCRLEMFDMSSQSLHSPQGNKLGP